MSDLVSLALCVPVAAVLAYLYLLAIAAVRVPRTAVREEPRTRFALAIPAHDEETVIAQTVRRLAALDYPPAMRQVFVVADYCTDATAERARAAGAACWERGEGERRSKGAALAWLFQRIFSGDAAFDAVVVFDADTLVAPDFLRIMDARLAQGAVVVQGCHRIVNANDSAFATLTWAMFVVDNRLQNLGRSNLGWSAKNMGDSICLRADILKWYGWGEGLTEDYQFRQRLLLDGIRIAYEPAAIGEGEAPLTWAAARKQRERWLSGTYRASRQFAWRMLREGLRRRDGALLDGAAQALLPSYSTLTLIAGAGLAAHLLFNAYVSAWLTVAWALLLGLLLLYPLVGLALEGAPLRAYVAVLLGPLFVVWRTVLSIRARFGAPVEWVRTARRGERTP